MHGRQYRPGRHGQHVVEDPGADQLQLRLDVLHDEADGHLVVAAARHDYVGVRHQRRDVVLERRLDEVGVLLQHALQVATAHRDVAPQTTRQSDVRVRVHKHFHVQQLQHPPPPFVNSTRDNV